MPNPVQTGTYLTPPPPVSDADFLGPNARYGIVSVNGRQFLSDVKGNEQFVIVTGSGTNIRYKVTSNYNEAQTALIKEFTKSAGIPALKKALLDSNYSTKAEYAKGDYLSGLVKAVQDFSIKNVAAYAYEGKKDFVPFSSFLKTSKAAAVSSTGKTATTKTRMIDDTSIDLTTVGDANKEINDYMLDVFGREATPEEKDAYYQDIHGRELKSSVTTTGSDTTKTNADGTISKSKSASTTLGAKVTQDERTNSMNAIARKALLTTDVNQLLALPRGSKVAVDIATLQSNSAAYGKSLSPADAIKMLADGFGQKDYLAKQTERMRLNAMTIFTNLKQHITDGGTVKDITDYYAKIKANKLGIVIPDSLADKDVMSAITASGGLLSTSDFNRQMQANPLWRQTQEAHDTASDFANTILKSFGFMG